MLSMMIIMVIRLENIKNILKIFFYMRLPLKDLIPVFLPDH